MSFNAEGLYGFDQEGLFDFGVNLAVQFLEHNSLGYPVFQSRAIPTANPPRGSYGCGVFLPRLNRILVTPARCARPASGRSPRQKSFPGNTSDRTPVGVVAHETGHYVDHVLDYPSQNDQWITLTHREKITSYEPNPSEAFAESMRLFILNPALLRAVAPRRYYHLGTLVAPKNRMTDPLGTLRAWKASPEILAGAAKKASA